MTVTRIKDYYGSLQIVEATDISVSRSISEVYVYDGYGTALDYDLQAAQNVRLFGEITSSEGSCGGSYSCFTLTHGLAETLVRTQQDLSVGDCVITTAAVSQYDGQTQLSMDREDWLTVGE